METLTTGVRLATDDDLLRLEPALDEVFPRSGRGGERIRDWDVQHALAADEIQRRLRSRRDVGEQFELGRLGVRTKEQLWMPAACLALHFAFVAMNTEGAADSFYATKAAHYYRMASASIDAVAVMMDYDADNSGEIGEDEKSMPFPPRIIRTG